MGYPRKRKQIPRRARAPCPFLFPFFFIICAAPNYTRSAAGIRARDTHTHTQTHASSAICNAVIIINGSRELKELSARARRQVAEAGQVRDMLFTFLFRDQTSARGCELVRVCVLCGEARGKVKIRRVMVRKFFNGPDSAMAKRIIFAFISCLVIVEALVQKIVPSHFVQRIIRIAFIIDNIEIIVKDFIEFNDDDLVLFHISR